LSQGGTVGYSIRFEDCTSARTRLKFCTDGMLLREALLDARLSRYSVVVIDEAHERTVHTDVLLGLLRRVMDARPEGFRLVVMSATLDADAFADFFGGARAVYVQGRQYPVQVLYTPEPEEDYLDAAMLTVLQVHAEEAPGDVLVFLTGQEEIDALSRLLAERAATLPPVRGGDAASSLLIAPLYAALPPEQQMTVFEPAPAGVRKVILATNIAETSLTIAGVRYVIDPGLSKQRAFNPRSGVDTLAVAPISRAAARQRAGRAGREAPGKCFRLYTEDAFHATLPAVTRPEILRANLGGVVLQLKALGVDDVLSFPLLDPPPRAALVRSLELLYALGALDDAGKMTRVGDAMARFPLEPMAAKALLAAQAEGCSEDVVAALAMLSAESVFFTPRDKEREARAARARFASPDGDHATLLRVLAGFRGAPARSRHGWCRDHFVNARALSRAADVAEQLRRGVAAAGVPLRAVAAGGAPDGASFGEDTAPLRRALTAGFFLQARPSTHALCPFPTHASSHACHRAGRVYPCAQVARRQPDGSYRTLAGSQTVHLHPSSVMFGRAPPAECILYNELVRTSKLYVRDVSVVEPAWLPELAPRFFAARVAAAAVGGPGGGGAAADC
jgi:ATP-dependent RNA helicase DHX8/PRP22